MKVTVDLLDANELVALGNFMKDVEAYREKKYPMQVISTEAPAAVKELPADLPPVADDDGDAHYVEPVAGTIEITAETVEAAFREYAMRDHPKYEKARALLARFKVPRSSALPKEQYGDFLKAMSE